MPLSKCSAPISEALLTALRRRLLYLDDRFSTSLLQNTTMHVTERFKALGLGRQVICITLACPSQELLLEKAWSTDFKKRLAWLFHG
jgi:hypothetical protein